MDTDKTTPIGQTRTAVADVPIRATAVFEALDQPVSVFTPDGAYVYVNPAGLALLEKSAAEVLGRRYLELFPDLATHPYHAAFERVASGASQIERLEFYYKPKDLWSSQRIHQAEGYVIVLWENITARKRAELRLGDALAMAAANERRFSIVFERSPFAICLTEMPSTKIVDVNPAFVALFGYRKEELLGKTSVELGMHVDLDKRERIKEQFARAGFVREMETHVRSKAGDVRVILNTLEAIELDGQKYVLGTFQDITPRKRAEAQLEDALARAAESERHFRAMIEWMPQLAWWAKPDGFIDYYNPRWYEYTGTAPKDMEGWGWQSVHDPEMLPSVMKRWQHSIASGEPFEMEFPLRRHDGVFRWFLTRITPMRDAADNIVRWVGINTDIDDQKRSVERLTEILESMSDGFHSLDRNWRFVAVNRNQERLSLKPRTETLGMVLWDMFPAAAAPTSKYWIEYHRVMETREPSHFVEHYAPLDLWTEVDAYPSREGISVFFRDVSERKRAEQQRDELLHRAQQARNEAEAANRTKDEFLAMLGHELRNPLAPIQTALELMRLRGSTGAERERTVIERQVRHMVRLVDDLLDVSRITRGKVELSRERLDLADITARAIEIASPLLEQRRHTLSAELSRGLLVDGDADRLAQVVSNLLTNAAKYTTAGGRITITGERRDKEVTLCVRDSGVGIAPDLLPKVFDLFVQGHQEIDRAQGGLGLGLAIVRHLVELHDGHVTVESEGVGRGSTFCVHLPAVDGTSATVDEVPVPFPLVTGGGPRERRVLVVDDNEDAAELLAEALQALGYATHVAYDGPSALGSLEMFKPDIAILDIGLPVMDGYELARRLRERPDLSPLRLVAVTGYGQEADRRRAREAGFDDHLVKPVDMNQLRTALEPVRVTS